jgi:hypothetical protein
MNENNDKKEEVDEVLKAYIEGIEKKRADPKFWEKKEPKSIYDMPRKYKLSEEERKAVPEKYKNYIRLRREAMETVKKYINKFKDDPRRLGLVEDLNTGLNILEKGYKRITKEGPEGLLADLERFQKGRRPGFGLSRGFGEFLYALPKNDEEWSDEVMDAVRKIERYYRSM